MVKTKWLYLLFAALITTLGCIDEIDFAVEDGETILAIEGQLSDSLASHTVTISKSIAYGAQSDFTKSPISGATVTLKSSVDADEQFFETEPGEYVYYGAGKIGASYSLMVTLSDGSSYQSTTHIITPPVPIENLEAQVYTEEYLNSNNVIATRDGVELTLSSKLEKDGEPTFALHQVQGEFKFEEFYPRILNIRTCYIKESLNFDQIMIFSGAELPDYSIKNERILETAFNYRFFFDYCFHVQQYTVDSTTNAYWSRVQEITSTGRSIFSSPPGKFHGNISNVNNNKDFILGFFTVGSVYNKKKFVNVNSLDGTIFPLCQPPRTNFGSRPPTCYDCLLFSNSTYTKPDYWP